MTENFVEAYDESGKMNVVCAWCGKHLRMSNGPFGTTSHGLCKTCFESLEKKIENENCVRKTRSGD